MLPPGPDAGAATESRPAGILYLLVLAYLLLDYGRPQDTIAGAGAIRPAMLITLLLTAALVVNFGRRVRGSGQLWCLVAFVGLLVAHVPFAHNNFYAYKTALAMVILLPFLFALPIAVNSAARLKRVVGFCVALMTYQAGYAILHGGIGTGAQFGDENDLSLFVNTYIPFATVMLAVERRFLLRLVYLAAIVVGTTSVVVSMSRGGFIGLLGVGSAWWLFSRRKLRSLVLVGVVAAGLAFFAGEAYWSEMSTATDAQTGTGKERVESWKSGLNMFVHRPLGVGGNNFQVMFPRYQTDYFNRGMYGRVAHSLWVTLLAELGILGVIAYGLLIFFNVRDSIRLRVLGRSRGGLEGRLLSGLGLAFLASMAGFFASGTFLSVLYYPHYWYLSSLIVAASRVATDAGPQRLEGSQVIA